MLEQRDLEQIKSVVTDAVIASEKRIISKINREISDLAEINRAVIAKVSVIPELEQRVLRLEQKLGLA